MVALYDYAAQGPEDLEFSEGDTIDILGEGEALQVNRIHTLLHLLRSESHCLSVSLSHSPVVNEEWLEGHSAGNIGIFPSCFAYRENGNITQSAEL